MDCRLSSRGRRSLRGSVSGRARGVRSSAEGWITRGRRRREPPGKGGSKGGRPPAPLRDALFVCVFKVYSTFSARRFASDLREAHKRGHLTEELSCDIAWKYLRKVELTPILHDLIVRSSLPLRSV